jgi:hypothetical protein
MQDWPGPLDSILEDERGGKIKIGYCVDNSDVQLCLTEIFSNAA